MPTYEYRCPNGHDFEKFFRSISSAEVESTIKCPECGAIALRQLSSAGLQFKGSGFYLTDYGKNAHGKKAPPASTSASDGASSGGGSDTSSSAGGGADSSSSGGSAAGGSGETGSAKEPAKKSDKPAPSAGSTNKPSSGTKGE